MAAWSNSDRRQRLPKHWAAIRSRVLRRDGHVCVQCGRPANQVDHIHPGDDHTFANLQSLCAPCHGRKSAKEGHAANRATPKTSKHPTPPEALLRRPAEPHPGLVRRP